MQIELSLEKSIEENAAEYFEKAKKAKKKLVGLQKAILETREKIQELERTPIQEKTRLVKKRKRQWFEVFHWFFSSDEFLVVGGRNAKSNEAIVKKHLEEGDLFLHADVHGGSACIIKAFGREIPLQDMREAAVFAGAFSSAWKQGTASVDVYAVQSNQVSKAPPTGESLGKGAFIISGKREWFRKIALGFFVGVEKENSQYIVISGPEQAIKKHSIAMIKIVQGSLEKSNAAKQILSALEKRVGGKIPIHLDEIVSMLPGPGIRVLE